MNLNLAKKSRADAYGSTTCWVWLLSPIFAKFCILFLLTAFTALYQTGRQKEHGYSYLGAKFGGDRIINIQGPWYRPTTELYGCLRFLTCAIVVYARLRIHCLHTANRRTWWQAEILRKHICWQYSLVCAVQSPNNEFLG